MRRDTRDQAVTSKTVKSLIAQRQHIPHHNFIDAQSMHFKGVRLIRVTLKRRDQLYGFAERHRTRMHFGSFVNTNTIVLDLDLCVQVV
tara:strand:- start:22943 stop:23206 length:264 start_codon:yes stop_codon:yes gene_type:complete